MKYFLFLVLLATAPAFAEIEYKTLPTSDGAEFQVCTRYPDKAKFPGPRPALFFIQGSGLYDTCLRLERQWATEIVERGVVIYSRQKRGIKVDPQTQSVIIDRVKFSQNDLPSLKEDSLSAFGNLQTNPTVDPFKIVVVGGSEGAWMATAIALKHPEVKEVSLIGSAIERFDVLFERQITSLIPLEIMAGFDKDNSHTLSQLELDSGTLASRGLRSFFEIDVSHDGQVTQIELAAEIRRVVLFGLATSDDTFFMSDIGGGVSSKWLKSAMLEPALGPKILMLKMPVTLHHGRADINSLVEPVYALEVQAQQEQITNVYFRYYDGLGHALTQPVLYQILFELADRANH